MELQITKWGFEMTHKYIEMKEYRQRSYNTMLENKRCSINIKFERIRFPHRKIALLGKIAPC